MLTGMEHTYFIVLAESTLPELEVASNTLIVLSLVMLLILGGTGSLIAGICSIKSSERIKFEQERTRQKAIEAVSEGKLSMEDAEKLLKPQKKAWWNR